MGTYTRYNWIDWMKAIGMFLIVYGHYFSYGATYIYVFNVPLFFIISGYLYKKETSTKVFWLKLFYNLIVPMLFLVVIMQLYLLTRRILWGQSSIYEIKDIILNIIIGQQKELGACWFIYTLALIKILRFYIPEKKLFITNLFIIPTFLLVSYYLSHKALFIGNAYTNTLLAYPIFAIGENIQKYKNTINSFSKKGLIVVMIILTLIIVLICGKYNGDVWMYKNDYGNSIVAFIIGGCAGTVLIFGICKLLDSYKSNIVQEISIGSLIILGVHYPFVVYTKIAPVFDVFSALILTLVFVPVIRFARKYCPLIIGIYRINNVK